MRLRIDEKGFPLYRRRDDGRFVYRNKGAVQLDNRWVVPHNLALLKRFQAHINIEWCNRTNLLKYLFKYVNKGTDIALVRLRHVGQPMEIDSGAAHSGRDEIDDYIRCRCVC